MATQEQVLALIRAAVARDNKQVVSIARQIEADLSVQNRHTAAQRIQRILHSTNQLIELPNTTPQWLWWEQPTRTLDSIELPVVSRAMVMDILRDHEHRGVLTDRGLKPRNRLFLYGPSGTGKTSLARALATELKVPLGIIRLGGVIDSHLGVTSANLERLFDALNQPCVVLFDEWDAMACSRISGDGVAGKESNRIVCTLLTLMDRLQSDCLMVAATNIDQHCDSAFARRFDVHLRVDLPSADDIQEYAHQLARRYENQCEVPCAAMDIDGIDLGHSYATAEMAVLDLARNAVIAKATATKGKSA